MRKRLAQSTLRERWAEFWEQLWHCEMLDEHQLKMDSQGRCVRCGRVVK